MKLSAAFDQSRKDMARHHLEARKAIAIAYVGAVRKKGAPGIPWRTGFASSGEVQSLGAPSTFAPPKGLLQAGGRTDNAVARVVATWPLGQPFFSVDNVPYAGILAGGRRRGRRGMLGSVQNRRGHLITADEQAQAAFNRFAWRPR